MRCSSGAESVSISTGFQHRTASPTALKLRPALGRYRVNQWPIPPPSSRAFLRFANLPNFALDRLRRYEATLWRQVGQILFALDALDRRKPQ